VSGEDTPITEIFATPGSPEARGAVPVSDILEGNISAEQVVEALALYRQERPKEPNN
jgi:hypothetical protein